MQRGGDAPGGSDGETWQHVGRERAPRHPLYSGLMRVLGECAYRLIARDERSGLVAYSIIAAGRLSRSGQPNSAGWRYLRGVGVRTIINLRLGEDDARLLRRLGFRGYLHLPIPDGLPPSEEQAVAFLRFVGDPHHWPAHVHCLTGIQRSGILAALVRYAIEGWPVEQALNEARRHFLGPTRLQTRWLWRWASQHPPGQWPWPSE